MLRRIRSFQERVWDWFLECFPDPKYRNTKERAFRFYEEATELAQSLGVSKEDCLKLVEYVYERPIGDPKQEVGGVVLTLNALCCHEMIDVEDQGEQELERVWKPEIMNKIRSKQVSKRLLMVGE